MLLDILEHFRFGNVAVFTLFFQCNSVNEFNKDCLAYFGCVVLAEICVGCNFIFANVQIFF